MLKSLRRQSKQERTRSLRESGPSSWRGRQNEVGNDTDRGGRKPLSIDVGNDIHSVACLVDGGHVTVVGGDNQGKIRKWRMQDGTDVGTPLNVGSWLCGIAVSRDGRWIVSGTWRGMVTVWNAQSHEKVIAFKGHTSYVYAVDISPDGTKIATGADDKTASIWLLSTGQRLLGPLEHDQDVCAAKFSPDGRLLATAMWDFDSVRAYDSRNGDLLVDVPIRVNSYLNRSLAWSIDGNQLFALSLDGSIHCLEPSRRTVLSQWPIHSSGDPTCIALNSAGTLIAASAGASVSFWNAMTHEQIGSVVEYDHDIWSMAMSDTGELVVGGDTSITISAPFSIIKYGLPPPYGANHHLESLREIIQLLQASFHAQQSIPNERGENTEPHLGQSFNSQCTIPKQDTINECMNSIRTILDARNEHSKNRIVHLEQTNQKLCAQLSHSQENLAFLERTNKNLRDQLAQSQENADLFSRINRTHEQKHQCESLYYRGRIYEAALAFAEMEDTMNNDVRANKFVANWFSEFACRCIVSLEWVGDKASNADKPDEAVSAYFTALLLRVESPAHISVLIKWVKLMLNRSLAMEVLSATSKFKVSKFDVYRVICDVLEDNYRLAEAFDCFQRMQLEDELTEDISERAPWELDFQKRCINRLLQNRKPTVGVEKSNERIAHRFEAPVLDQTNQNKIILNFSNEVIKLDQSSHIGYEGKHAALHCMGLYGEAFKAFRMMLSKLEQSSDPQLRELRREFVDATLEIQIAVEQAIRHIPRVLIDTETGRLYDKAQQAAAFKEAAIYDELRSSMTAQLDRARIRKEVKAFYNYVMFSHKWQPDEPTFQMVENTSIYLLPSTAFSKLQHFCKVVQALRFKWAWSDTCCVNQLDKGVLQESLVAMFKWYRSATLTIIHLLGVFSESQEAGCLWRSVWNTRGWTYQEYLASEVVQFYTEDWKPYLGLDIFNHKESSVILSEMEQAMNFAQEELETLRPGLDRAREKLYLASKRHTTREEDMAYCLFGIFNVALPIIYGEGNQAIGRLLEHILTRSDNVTLLAWTGSHGSHHSYLPAELTVYDKIVPPHIPMPTKSTEMDVLATTLRSKSPDLSLITSLYKQLWDLPTLTLVSGRLRLPGIVFTVTNLTLLPESHTDSASDLPVYRGSSSMLGDINIVTGDDLSGTKSALLIHPWISPLLDEDFACGEPLFDETTRALRLVIRLKQPFGALLLAPLGRTQYRRVATDSLIMVQVREETSLEQLMDGIRTVDIQ